MNANKFIYCNNKLMDTNETVICMHDRGLLLADGLFETLRIYQGKVPQFDQHWQRFYDSAHFLELALAMTKEKLYDCIKELLAANNIATQDAGLRITLTRGAGARGLWPVENQQPTLLLHTFTRPTLPQGGFKVIISSIKKNHLSPLARIKSLNYLENILARREAYNANANESILCNVFGHVAEASTANLFIVKHGIVMTPRIDDGALPGIARATVLELCQQRAIKTKETTLTVEDLYHADEAFLTNALLPIGRIQCIDNKPFHYTSNNNLTEQLQQAYQARYVAG